MKRETNKIKQLAWNRIKRKFDLFHVSRFTFHEKGFTLIELMVAVGVFSIAITASSGLFITSLRGQQRTYVVQNLADNARYAMEAMAKEMRMGSGFSGATCAGNSCSFISHMMHRDGKNVKFSLGTDAKIMFDDGISELPITSANIEVTSLDFELIGGSDTTQERVVIVMQAKVAGNSPYASAGMTLQTTISPRAL